MNVNVTLTEKECQVLQAIMYSTIGGDPGGPRSIVSDIMRKIPHSCGPYTANIEVVHRMGSQAVVVREQNAKKED